MKTYFYLVVNSKGTTRTVKTKPGLDWNEISIRIDLTLPDSLFQKPSLNAVIEIPQDKVNPTTIDVEMSNNIAQAIEQATGHAVKISIAEPAES